MRDYTWPSVFFSYGFFGLCAAMAVFFFVRSWKDGYWGKSGEDVKFTVFEGEEGPMIHHSDTEDTEKSVEVVHGQR